MYSLFILSIAGCLGCFHFGSFVSIDFVKDRFAQMIILKNQGNLETIYGSNHITNRFFKLCRLNGRGTLLIRVKRTDEIDGNTTFYWHELNATEIPAALIADIILNL